MRRLEEVDQNTFNIPGRLFVCRYLLIATSVNSFPELLTWKAEMVAKLQISNLWPGWHPGTSKLSHYNLQSVKAKRPPLVGEVSANFCG
jgi:hypothetical protein